MKQLQPKAKTIAGYLKALSSDRRKAITALRRLIRKNLPKGYQESLNWGMIAYEVPLKVFPKTYNGQPLAYAGLASQKNYMTLYLMSLYILPGLEKWFRGKFKEAGKKIDLGKCCLRFKKIEDLALPAVANLIAKTPMKEYIRRYERSRK